MKKDNDHPVDFIPDEGFLGRYIRAMGAVTEAPMHYHLFVGLTIMAGMLGRKVYVPWAGGRLFPNLYVMILGESTVTRKSTSAKKGESVLDWYRELTGEDLLRTGHGSPEALKTELIESKGRGVYIYDEYRSFAELARKPYAEDLIPLMTHLYDCPDRIRIRTEKKGLRIIESPCVSFLSCSTPAWFETRISKGDFEGGWLPRFIHVVGDRPSKLLPVPPGISQNYRSIIESDLEWLSEFPETEMELWHEAEVCFEIFYRDLNKEIEKAGPILSPLLARMGDYVIKLAMLLSINIKREYPQMSQGVIFESEMEMAINIIEWVKASVRVMVKRLAFDKDQKRIRDIRVMIEDHPGITEREIYRSMNLQKSEVKPVLETLEAMGYKRVLGNRADSFRWHPPHEDEGDEETPLEPTNRG